jgi:glycosyltransferase involved in cell wall biosynthesis
MADTLDRVRDTPEVTVVIPTRNRRPVLMRTLASALAQEEVDLEAVVVDDGSSDDTAAAVRGHDDPRVTLVRREPSSGVAATRNAGIAAAHGRWVAFLDDDDLWSPRKLRMQLEVAYAAKADFAYTAAVFVTPELDPIRVRSAPDPAKLLERLPYVNPVPAGGSTVIVRTELVRELEGFDERLSQLADWDLWWQLAEVGTAAACDEPLVAYVVHPGSMLSTDRRDVLRERDYLDSKHGVGEEARRHPDRIWFWRWAAEGAVRAGHRGKAASLFLRGALAHRSGLDVRLALGTLVRGSPEKDGQQADRRLERTPAWLERYRSSAAVSR